MSLPKRFLHIWKKAPSTVRHHIVFIISGLLLFNVTIWLAGLFFASLHPVLLGLLVIAYGLGLRHAVDADHIAAIDNTTRKLMLDGKKPTSVGLFFSLGHATVVIILSLLVAFSSSFIKHAVPVLQTTGATIGTFISSFFLLCIGCINLVAFMDIFRVFRCVRKGGSCREKLQYGHIHLTCMGRIFKPLLAIISSSWQMYFVGFLFGLGFDTASEVGLLSISAGSGASGVSPIEILLLPLAFTAGMALIDTLDGILMLGAYGWAYIKPVRKLYYNLNITFISVLIAFFIGTVEGAQLLSSQLKLHGVLFEQINKLNTGKLGYFTIFIFLLFCAISITIYKMKQYDQMS